MKKIVIIVIMTLVMLAIPALGAIKGSVMAAGVTLNASLLKYEPVPAHPGDNIDVWVKLGNQGGDMASNVRLEFLDNYPFRLESEERRLHNIGSLPGGYDYVAKFNVRVAPDAPVGTAYIKVRHTYGGLEDRWVEKLLPVDIESRITSLSIEEVRTEPSNLEPGGTGKLIVNVRNMADSLLRRVSLKLDLQGSNAPIAPVSSGTELKIDSLAPGDSHEFEFNIIAELNAEANAYRIPVNVSFTEDTGTEISYDDTIGILISSDPDMVITIDSTDIYTNQPSGIVTLKFVNKGVDEVKFVYFSLLPSDTYELLSPTTDYYVGNIDSDDYEVEDIRIRARGPGVLIPMQVEYRDSANVLYSTNETVAVNLVAREEVEDTSSFLGSPVFWILLIAVIGYFAWRRFRKKRSAE